MPFGEVRTITGYDEITETDFGFTGQRVEKAQLSPNRTLAFGQSLSWKTAVLG